MKTTGQIIIFLFIASLVVQFQNCSVYKSDGRKAFESSIEQSEDKGCYPYIDTNIAMDMVGVADESFEVYKTRVSGEDAYTCDFRATNSIFNHINCKVSQGNGELAVLLAQDGAAAFPGTVGVFTAGVRAGFNGTHGGYITLDDDNMFTIKYLALDGSEKKGVGCAVRLLPADYGAASAQVQATLSQITFEMAIQNKE